MAVAESQIAQRVPVSAMIFTLDEEIHLPSCLAALAWTDDVIVVDSFSKDATERICREAGARFFQHAFEGFGKQRVWALDHTQPKYDWILILDADERVTPELAAEMARVVPAAPEAIGAYRLKRRFHMWGRWLRYSSLYPTWVVRLVRKGRVQYVNRGHAETQQVNGEIASLEHDLIDENLKGVDEWFERQNRYSTREAE
jgi:glycosyltransferase involved in cell wall biosynthesis